MSYNRIIGGIRLRQERSGTRETKDMYTYGPCDKGIPELLPFYGYQCAHGKGYEIDPEMWVARSTNANENMTWWLNIREDVDVIQRQVLKLEIEKWFDRWTRKVEP